MYIPVIDPLKAWNWAAYMKDDSDLEKLCEFYGVADIVQEMREEEQKEGA